MSRIGVLHPQSGGAVVHLEGLLDDGEADRIAAVIVGLRDDGPVAVDLHDARAVEDHALVRLARALASATGRYHIVGLSGHHSRLLRYVGLEGVHSARAPADDA
ncbi:MAG TPA: hypothetical protein VMU15_12455 [Anaeromyxobacter sp.]|nr:hypothetical protein [Anaeromyxobacter sp.]